jgi:hypothetical protein
MFLFLLVDFKFENGNFGEWEKEASRAWDLWNCEVGLVICKRKPKYDYFHWIFD